MLCRGCSVCSADGQTSDCNAEVIAPAADDAFCDQIDGDCDGKFDEDAYYTGPAEDPSNLVSVHG